MECLPGDTQEWIRITRVRSPAAAQKPAFAIVSGTTRSASLDTEMTSVREQIRFAQEEDARCTDSFVKSLIAARLATLRQTEAMLQLAALRSGYILDTSTSRALRAIEQEAAANRARIAAQEAEIARYSGGIALTVSQTTLATLEQTQALIDQRRLALEFGLKSLLGAQSTSGSLPAASGGTLRTQVAEPKTWRVVSIDSRVTEVDSGWSKFAWKLTLANDATRSQRLQGNIEFQDRDEFIVGTSSPLRLVVPAQSEQEFTGFALIKSEVAGNVTRTVAKMQPAGAIVRSAPRSSSDPGWIGPWSATFFMSPAGKAAPTKKTAAGKPPTLH